MLARVCRNKIIKLSALLLLLTSSMLVHSGQVSLVLSSSNSIYREVGDQIISELASTHSIKTSFANEPLHPDSDLIVTLGSAALESVADIAADTPVLASLIPQRSYTTIIKQAPTSLKSSAIYINQPMDRQLRFAQVLIPKIKTISSLFGPSSIDELHQFTSAANALNLDSIYAVAKSNSNPVNLLRPIINESDLMIAIPDRTAFNRAAAKWSIFLSLRLKKPLIGFSKQYVHAGALAAIYTSPIQIAQQSIANVKAFFKSNVLPDSQPPNSFSIEINHRTAQALNIEIPPTDQIRNAVEQGGER